jgi:hypothetical protein
VSASDAAFSSLTPGSAGTLFLVILFESVTEVAWEAALAILYRLTTGYVDKTQAGFIWRAGGAPKLNDDLFILRNSFTVVWISFLSA